MGSRKGFVFLGVYIIGVVLIELLLFNRQYFLRQSSDLDQRHLPVEGGILHELSQENGRLMAQGTDPSIVFNDLNTKIQSISIQCKNTKFGASGQVFYQSSDRPFNESNSIAYSYARLSGYNSTVWLPKTEFVSDLRIDVTNIDGDILTCQDFVVNPFIKFNLSTSRLMIYLCVLILGTLGSPKSVFPGNKHLQYPFSLSSLPRLESLFSRLSKKKFVLFGLVWVLLWLLPWEIWLDDLPWLRLGLSLLMFSLPGMVLSLLLARDRLSLTGHFISGLALSVFWVGTLGFAGRVLHWPFENIKILFAGSGLIGLLVLARFSTTPRPLYKPDRFSRRTLILLLFMIVFGILANFQSRHSGDDLSYLAYLTTWQHAPQLDFREVNFGVGTADSIRFWWGMFPMSLALLAGISHLHGLLLVGFYLEPFLVVFAILAIYALYKDLLSSQDQAMTAVLFQFTFLFMLRGSFQPGYMLFERLSDDKVFAAFVLTPVFFLAVRFFLASHDWQSGLLILLIGSSLSFTHTIVLAYCIFIAGIYSLVVTILKQDFKQLVLVILILFIIIVPSAGLRFVDETWVDRQILGLEPGVTMPDNFSLDTARGSAGLETYISPIEGTRFYGFKLDGIQIMPNNALKTPLSVFLSWSYVWILAVGFLWSLFNLKRDPAAPFVLASSFLVILCAIPYTGWLVGYFVTARMLWRAPWLLPIGLISFVLLKELFDRIELRLPVGARAGVKSILYTGIPIACLVLVAWFSEFVYPYQWLSTQEQLDDYRNSLSRLSKLGNYLEGHIEQPSRFLAPIDLMNYLPGLSSKSKVVLLRNAAWAPYPVDVNEISEIFSDNPEISMNRRTQILDKYGVRYVLMEDADLKDYYADNHSLFSAEVFDDFWILKYRK